MRHSEGLNNSPEQGQVLPERSQKTLDFIKQNDGGKEVSL